MSLTEGNKELRKFGLSFAMGLMIISTILKVRGKAYIYLPPFSVLIFLSALIRPQILKPLKISLEKIFNAVTTALTTAILVVLFYIILTPLGAIAKLFGRNFLKLKYEAITSYFEKRLDADTDNACHERQF